MSTPNLQPSIPSMPPQNSAGEPERVLPHAGSIEPPKPKKSRPWLWISLVCAAVLVAAAAVVTPLIIGSVQQGEAEREFDVAVTELEQAQQGLAAAMQTAAQQARATPQLRTLLVTTGTSDQATAEQIQGAQDNLLMVAGPTVDPASDDVPSESVSGTRGEDAVVRPKERQELRDAALQLRHEATELVTKTEAIDEASQSLWDAQLAGLAVIQAQGAELISKATSKASEGDRASLQAAIDALNTKELHRGETDLAALLNDVTSAWGAVKGAMTPTWNDLNGTWCGGSSGGCTTIENLVDREHGASFVFRQMKENCFFGSYVPPGSVGGANILYCPAGVPTPSEYRGSRGGGKIFETDDESRDRFWGYQGVGVKAFFRQ